MNTRYQHSSFANPPQITRSMLQSNDSLLHDSLLTPPDSLPRATSPAACDVPAMCNRHALTQCAWKPFLLVQQCLRRSAEHLRFSRCPLRNLSAMDRGALGRAPHILFGICDHLPRSSMFSLMLLQFSVDRFSATCRHEITLHIAADPAREPRPDKSLSLCSMPDNTAHAIFTLVLLSIFCFSRLK